MAANPPGPAPFDPVALVAMLQAFYPSVSAAAFAQARAERPEYFAGGTIFGSKGDKLRLPDGREYDCIVAAGGPPSGRRWQCAPITGPGDGGDDPFALEDGPLAYLDDPGELFPPAGETFEQLVARGLGGLQGSDAVLANAHDVTVAFTGVQDLDNAYADEIDPAVATHENVVETFDQIDPSSVITATAAQDPVIDQARQDYVEPEQPQVAEPDPGDRPDPSDKRDRWGKIP